jgi:hypothetical protein
VTIGKGLKVEAGTRRYKVLLPVTVHLEDGTYVQGDVFDHVFTAEDEWANVDSGLLGLEPDWYEVIGDSTIEVNLIECPASRQRDVVQPGETFQAAVPLAREEQLRFHIRRVAAPPPVKPEKSTRPPKE